MENRVELSIIIVNYNTFDLTAQCIKSIIQETEEVNFEIIVVDNNSTEKEITKLPSLFPKVKLIQNKTNLGFGIANNIGMEASKGIYILLLNSDTIIIDSGLDRSFGYIKSHIEIDMLTCQQINDKKESFVPANFYFKTNSLFQYLVQNPVFQLIKNKLNPSKSTTLQTNSFVKNLSGAFLLFKRKLYTNTRGFDPDFFIYYEETEWCMRLRKHYTLFYLQEVSFVHLHGKSAPRLIMQKQMHLSGGLFWYKNGVFSYFMFMLISYFIYLPSWLVLTLFAFKQKTRKHFFKHVKIYFDLLPYFLFDIPKSNTRYQSRKHSLKLNSL